jgi:hypothetical protein
VLSGAQGASMSKKEVIRFYERAYIDDAIQQELLATKGRQAFIDKALELASAMGFNFTKNELQSTFEGKGEVNYFDDIDFGSKWISKIIALGWVPKGHSR